MQIMAAIATSINRVSITLSIALLLLTLLLFTLDVDVKLCAESLKMLLTHGALSLSTLDYVLGTDQTSASMVLTSATSGTDLSALKKQTI